MDWRIRVRYCLLENHLGGLNLPLDSRLDFACLLQHVRQFVSDQSASFELPWRKLTRAKHDVVPHRVSVCVHVPRRLLGRRIRVHPHTAEVVAEALLHVLP